MSEYHLNALPTGYRLQEYELVRVLGLGGFGITYLSFDHHLDKAVAIKEYFPSELAARSSDQLVCAQSSTFEGDFSWGLSRFLDEARTLARFQHPNVIQVYRFFEAHGTGYIVMEYAEGETLSSRLDRLGTLSESELLGVVLPLLDGLAEVHGAGVLHRDIKPGNIMVRAVDGSPVLLDFGSARQAIGAKSRSLTSVITPGYAPIEQYSAQGDQGPWTDIYALGGVCYHALTGQVPLDAPDRMFDDSQASVSELCEGRVSTSNGGCSGLGVGGERGRSPVGCIVLAGCVGGGGDCAGGSTISVGGSTVRAVSVGGSEAGGWSCVDFGFVGAIGLWGYQ